VRSPDQAQIALVVVDVAVVVVAVGRSRLMYACRIDVALFRFWQRSVAVLQVLITLDTVLVDIPSVALMSPLILVAAHAVMAPDRACRVDVALVFATSRRSWRGPGDRPNITGGRRLRQREHRFSVNIDVKDTKISVNRLRRMVFLLGIVNVFSSETVLRLGMEEKRFRLTQEETRTHRKFREIIGFSEVTLGASESGKWAGLRLHRGYGQRTDSGQAPSLGRQFIQKFL